MRKNIFPTESLNRLTPWKNLKKVLLTDFKNESDWQDLYAILCATTATTDNVRGLFGVASNAILFQRHQKVFGNHAG